MNNVIALIASIIVVVGLLGSPLAAAVVSVAMVVLAVSFAGRSGGYW